MHVTIYTLFINVTNNLDIHHRLTLSLTFEMMDKGTELLLARYICMIHYVVKHVLVVVPFQKSMNLYDAKNKKLIQ
jgi:hypothetical protein